MDHARRTRALHGFREGARRGARGLTPDALPIDEALPLVRAALVEGSNLVLVAPPGAGKTTRVPLALLEEPWLAGRKILVLEPRRVAARSAAERMAATLDERVGETVGLRARLATRVGSRTRIEVVTEGVFTRTILGDAELSGVGAVLFDEFHERSLDADLGLALALDAQAGLREDLRIVLMSATLDGARAAALLGDAAIVESAGRAFPVETRYLGRDSGARLEQRVVDAILRAMRSEAGSLLVFLPGQAEIRRVERRLAEFDLPTDVLVTPLHGGLDARAQDRAVAPAPPGIRKIVLATSIAESSLTIEGVRGVIDSGLSRVPRYEPDLGITRLDTVRVSRASADQRRGRAGRTQPGFCWRLWDEPETASLRPFADPEILAADLSPLLLDLALWGVRDPGALRWLDPPPGPASSEARGELVTLGALDKDGRITAVGRRLAALPLPPRLARMIVTAADGGAALLAAEVAALLVERGLGGEGSDITHRLDGFRRDRSERASGMRRLAAGWARQAEEGSGGARPGDPPSPAALLALAWPGRIAKARGAPGAFLLANGRGAALDPADPLSRAPFLAVAELAGRAAQTRILLAASLGEGEIEAVAGGRILESDQLSFDRASGSLRARRVRSLDALTLSAERRPVPGTEEAAKLLANGVAETGIDRLAWSAAQRQFRARLAFLRGAEPDVWPDLSDEALARAVEDWLAPFLSGITALVGIGPDVLQNALDAAVPWELRSRAEDEAPTHFTAPTGERHPIDWNGEGAPGLAIRVQQLFGLTEHPAVAGGTLPLTLTLLSPAHRPIQITRDLPSFWRGSWAAVKAEMRGRYPRHPWPDNPASAAPTTRAKPRT